MRMFYFFLCLFFIGGLGCAGIMLHDTARRNAEKKLERAEAKISIKDRLAESNRRLKQIEEQLADSTIKLAETRRAIAEKMREAGLFVMGDHIAEMRGLFYIRRDGTLEVPVLHGRIYIAPDTGKVTTTEGLTIDDASERFWQLIARHVREVKPTTDTHTP